MGSGRDNVTLIEMAGPEGTGGPVPMPPEVSLLGYQRQLVESPDRFTWSCWSRQTGKSFTLSLRRVVRAMKRRKTQILLSAGMRQCRELMLKVQQHCHAMRVVAEVEPVDGKDGTQIRLPGGVRVIALPARPETVRGYTGDVLLDEFAMHRNDREIWAAIFPSILRGQGEIDIASTPKGKANLFYELGQNDSFRRSTLTLPQAIAQGLDIDMQTLRKAMGDEDLFRQEFLCEFLDETDAFMPYGVIAACEDSQVEKDVDWAALRASQADVYAGVDVARKRDLTVVWLWRRHEATAGQRGQVTGNSGPALHRRDTSRTGGQAARGTLGSGRAAESQPGAAVPHPATALTAQAWTLRCVGVIEMAATPFRQQQEMIRRVLELRCVRRCCIDATGMGWSLAEWAQEVFGQGRVEAVVFTAGLKAQMASQLRRLAEEQRLAIPAGEESIRNDWHSVRRSTNANGGLRLDAARSESGHADRFWAAALGAYAAETGATGPLEYATTGQPRFSRRGMW